jgi:hypothetical protein
LLIHAEWDVDVTFDTARDFFSRLTAAPYRRWIEIGHGTHMVILEKNRWQAVNSIIEFLSEDVAAALEAQHFAIVTPQKPRYDPQITQITQIWFRPSVHPWK